jgi:hypothetical protein
VDRAEVRRTLNELTEQDWLPPEPPRWTLRHWRWGRKRREYELLLDVAALRLVHPELFET